jgi:hypothetical protein
MNSNRILFIAVVGLASLLLGRWTLGPANAAPPARDMPAAFNQNEKTIDELKAVNEKLDRLVGLLESGKLEVRVAAPAAPVPASEPKGPAK